MKSATGMVLRRATAADIPVIALIETQSFADPWPESAFSTLLSRRYAHVLVADAGADGLAGYCILLAVADEGEIANIAVAPAFRGKGVGGRLLDEAMSEARERGVRQLFLEVRVSNEPALSLYTSRGFQRVGRRKRYYAKPVEDALVLRWAADAILR